MSREKFKSHASAFNIIPLVRRFRGIAASLHLIALPAVCLYIEDTVSWPSNSVLRSSSPYALAGYVVLGSPIAVSSTLLCSSVYILEGDQKMSQEESL